MIYWPHIQARLAVIRRIPNKYYFIAGVLLVMAVYIILFREKTLVYSYGNETCDRRLIVFPGTFRQSDGDGYTIRAKGGWKVAGQQLTATSLCVSPVEPPAEHTSQSITYAPWGAWMARFTYSIEVGKHPAVDAAVLQNPIPVSRALRLPLSEPDMTFSYKLEGNDGEALCEPSGSELSCDLPALKLKQGSKYTLAIEKYFKDKKIDEVTQANIETLSPLSVTATSIERDATVYDKPTAVTVAVDKPLRKAEFAVWRVDGDAPSELEASTEAAGQEIVVTFTKELPRQATIELRAESLEAKDGSTPLDPYALPFKTSGGPKVTGVNVGASGVAPGAQIVVTFDQDLAADQDLGPLVTTAGGVALQARRGNQLVFSTGEAGKCAGISIALKADIASPHGIAGQSAWQYNGRIRCYTVTTLGVSMQGRAITAYHFGDSGPAVLYTGAIHGNEASTKYLMDRWIQDLDANPSKIPAGKRVIVVPTINPDGFARGTRTNARNVDLNRNFATGDWQKDIENVNGGAFPGGGGEEPMSELETRAIANFVAQQRPELVISYHSIGGLVISNQRGQAGGRASQYASLSGYRHSGGDSGEFGYSITGTADDYYGEKLGVPSILIELGSHSYHQFERNQAAMWAMLR